MDMIDLILTLNFSIFLPIKKKLKNKALDRFIILKLLFIMGYDIVIADTSISGNKAIIGQMFRLKKLPDENYEVHISVLMCIIQYI